MTTTAVPDFRTKTREFTTIVVNNGKLEVHKVRGGTTVIPLEQIVGYRLKRSIYDIPFFEKTVILELSTGRKLKLKRIRTRAVALLQDLLENELDCKT